MKAQSKYFIIVFTYSIFFISFLIASSSAQTQSIIKKSDPIEFTYFYTPTCDICKEKEPIVNNFTASHPEVKFINYSVDWGNRPSKDFFLNYTSAIGLSKVSTPLFIMNKTNCYIALEGENITAEALEYWYQKFLQIEGSCPIYNNQEVKQLSPWVIFVSGLITGLSPCVILITAVMSSSLAAQEEKLKLMPLFIGFILGVFLVYLLLSWALISTFQFFTATFFGPTIRIVFAVIMIALGIWFLIDAFNENSKLFNTPEKIKKLMSKLAKKGTFIYAFVLGAIFTFIKLPCVGGIFLAITYNLALNPSQYLGSLLIFFLGILLPLVILMLIIYAGVQNQKIDEVRKKYRPHLRIISGLLIIGITIYSLFFLW